MVINDQFTKMLTLTATKDRTAKTTAGAIYDYVMNFGIPERLYSDKDPAFEAELFQELMQLLGIKKLRTTGYNPKANGLTEVSNRFTKGYLTKYCNRFPASWDQFLREAAYAYNTSKHSSTSFTPAFLMFGREFRMPTDILYPVKTKSPNGPRFLNYTNHADTMSVIYELARQSNIDRQTKAKSHYDKKIRDHVLEVGQAVLVLNPRYRSTSLTYRWQGPAEVKEVKHPVYRVEHQGRDKWLLRDRLKCCDKSCSLDSRFEILNQETVETKVHPGEDKESDEEIDFEPQVMPQRVPPPIPPRVREIGGHRLRPNPAPPARFGCPILLE